MALQKWDYYRQLCCNPALMHKVGGGGVEADDDEFIMQHLAFQATPIQVAKKENNFLAIFTEDKYSQGGKEKEEGQMVHDGCGMEVEEHSCSGKGTGETSKIKIKTKKIDKHANKEGLENKKLDIEKMEVKKQNPIRKHNKNCCANGDYRNHNKDFDDECSMIDITNSPPSLLPSAPPLQSFFFPSSSTGVPCSPSSICNSNNDLDISTNSNSNIAGENTRVDKGHSSCSNDNPAKLTRSNSSDVTAVSQNESSTSSFLSSSSSTSSSCPLLSANGYNPHSSSSSLFSARLSASTASSSSSSSNLGSVNCNNVQSHIPRANGIYSRIDDVSDVIVVNNVYDSEDKQKKMNNVFSPASSPPSSSTVSSTSCSPVPLLSSTSNENSSSPSSAVISTSFSLEKQERETNEETGNVLKVKKEEKEGIAITQEENLKEELDKTIKVCQELLRKDRISACQEPLLDFINKCNASSNENEVKECLKLLYTDGTFRDIVDLLCEYKEVYQWFGKEDKWQQIKCRVPGVKSYMREEDPSVNDGKISYTVRYKGVIRVDPFKLLTVVVPEHAPKYDYMTESAETLHRYSEFHGIAYVVNNFRVPMLSKRDWVVEYSLDASPDGRLSYAMKSIHQPHPFVPKEYEGSCDRYVRGNLIKCGSVYEPISPNVCYFESFINADIIFPVPSWLLRYITTQVGSRLLEIVVNIAEKDMGENTFFGDAYRERFPRIQPLHEMIVKSQQDRLDPFSASHHTIDMEKYPVEKWSSELPSRAHFPLLDILPKEIIGLCRVRTTKPSPSISTVHRQIASIVHGDERNTKKETKEEEKETDLNAHPDGVMRSIVKSCSSAHYMLPVNSIARKVSFSKKKKNKHDQCSEDHHTHNLHKHLHDGEIFEEEKQKKQR